MVIRLAGELQAMAFFLNERRVPGLYPKEAAGGLLARISRIGFVGF